MSIKDLLNITVRIRHYSTMKDGEVVQVEKRVGVITANQAAVTFAGAPVLVTLIWKVVGLVFPPVLVSNAFPVVLSLIVGLLIYWQSAPTEGTAKDKLLGFIFALLNSFAIAGTVLGIDNVVGKLQ